MKTDTTLPKYDDAINDAPSTKESIPSTKSKHKIRYKKKFGTTLTHESIDYINSKKQICASANVINGEKNGCCTMYYEGTELIRKQVMYISGKRNGYAMKYYKSGQIYTIIHYVNNVRHGDFYKYDESGNIVEECTYVNGKKHGVHILYFDASVVIKQSTEYRNGIKHGENVVFDSRVKDSMYSVYEYYEGELFSFERHDRDGTIIEER
jgi:antitoxin component YwqK of YwqJK toxin-antitoxin module